MARVALPVCVVLATASACSGKRAAQATPTTGRSTAIDASVAATTPAVPSGTKVCATVSSLAGWPSTTPSRPDAYVCILAALAAGTPAQMSTISGTVAGGRKTRVGHDLPNRLIVTLRVLGRNKVQVITDRTDDGGTVTTRTCRGLAPDSLGFHGTGCS